MYVSVLITVFCHAGVPSVFPKTLIMGGSGRCGTGAAYILEKIGFPR
jgi:hypothetical protein